MNGLFFVVFIEALCLCVTIQWTACHSMKKANIIDKIGATLKIKKYVRSVVIDIESQDIRAFVFTYIGTSNGKYVKLMSEKEVEVEAESALTSSNNTKVLEDTLTNLLQELQYKLSRNHWPETYLSVYGSSQFRSEARQNLNNILHSVNEFFSKTSFRTVNNSMTILSETDETFLSWLSANLLLGSTVQKKVAPVAVLGLRGHSAQTAFTVKPNKVVTYVTRQMQLYGLNHQFYINSEHGLGLNEARKAVLTYGTENNSSSIKSDCFSPYTKTEWAYKEKIYFIQGKTDGLNVRRTSQLNIRFNKCLETIKSSMWQYKKIQNLVGHVIYAIYDFYYLLNISHLINGSAENIEVGAIFEHAKYVCQLEHPSRPFSCLDTTYMYVLLHYYYGLGHTDNIYVAKYINGYSLNWFLSASFIKHVARQNNEKQL